MKFLVDENLPPGWVSLLNDAGIEAYEWSSLGAASATDAEIVEYAVRHAFVILTPDLDFEIYLATTHTMAPSVVQVRTLDTNPAVIGKQVVAAIELYRNELLAGAMVTVEAWSTPRMRLRMLPILSRDGAE